MQNRILIVEDDQDMRDLLTRALLDDGHRVFAASREWALYQFGLVQPDLIILDVLLPGRDRWTALHRIRELSSVPILALAPSDDEAARVESLDRGADSYVTEPYGVPELRARVHALLRRTQKDYRRTWPIQLQC